VNKTFSAGLRAPSNIGGPRSKGPTPGRGDRKPPRKREMWSDDEHRKFVEALGIHHRNWKEVAAHVGTKTVVQV
jgi:hypothetical protein